MNPKEKLKHIEYFIKTETRKVNEELEEAGHKNSADAKRSLHYNSGKLYVLRNISRLLKL